MITSEDFWSLKKWNKKAIVKKNIRVGVTVITKRGVGIVTTRDKEEVWVAHESDSLLWCHTYTYHINDVMLSNKDIDKESKLYKGAWQNIRDSAIVQNQNYEIEKHKRIVKEWSHLISGRKEKRTISTSFGSYDYVRFIGDDFDFEICVNNPFIPNGDRVLYAIGKGDGYITDMNGYGRIYRRKIKQEDVNYGLAKYVTPYDITQ